MALSDRFLDTAMPAITRMAQFVFWLSPGLEERFRKQMHQDILDGTLIRKTAEAGSAKDMGALLRQAGSIGVQYTAEDLYKVSQIAKDSGNPAAPEIAELLRDYTQAGANAERPAMDYS